MSDVLSAIDWRGNRIEVGDRVLYPRMSGRSVEIQEGEILNIVAVEAQRWNRGAQGYEPYTAYKYRIQPTRSSREFISWERKPVTIHIGENVTALHHN